MKRRASILTLPPLLLLAACSQEPTTPTPGNTLVSQYGSVAVVRSRTGGVGTEVGGVVAFGVFGAFARPQPLPAGTPAGLGSCTVTRAVPTPAGGTLSPPTLPVGLTSLDAGEALTLSTAAGPYARLGKTAVGGSVVYSSLSGGGITLGPLPAGLRLEIPGASGGFPTFGDVAVPGAPPLNVSTPNLDQPVTADATFSWQAAPGEAGTTTVVTLQLAQVGAGGAVSAQCLVADTGNFQLPQGTKDELRRAGFAASTSVTLGRTRTRLAQQGDTAVSVSASEVLTSLTPGGGQ